MITKELFGKKPCSCEVYTYTLTNKNGAYIKILTMGGILQQINIPDRDGIFADVICGFDTVEDYPYNINLLCLENISEAEIIEKVKKIGWVPPKDVDGCSSNCQLNTFNNYVHQKKYGYNPYELELSHLIRKGMITREEALVKLNDQPEETLRFVMEQLEIDRKILDPTPEQVTNL
jgi:hypothetical protein